jgi:hypothetical protein
VYLYTEWKIDSFGLQRSPASIVRAKPSTTFVQVDSFDELGAFTRIGSGASRCVSAH